MLETIKKYKKFVLDLIVNTFSLTIYIISQQLIFMPIMGKLISENAFAAFIVYISIFSIISNSLGSELGIVRQILEHKNKENEYNKILFILLFGIFGISFICISFLKYSLLETIILSLIIVLANIRLYASAFFRMNKEFKKVLLQNLLYLLGLCIGLLIFMRFNYIWLPSLIAEIFPLLYSVINTDIKKFSIKNLKCKIDKNILKSFKDYSMIEILINMMTYFDKILIYPILGTLCVNVYYATTTMSKVISLIVNPLHGVILSWLKKDSKKEKKTIVDISLKFCIPLVVIVSIISIPITYMAVKILYEQYLEAALKIIIPISIGVGFSVVSTIIKAFLLKFVESNKLVKTYLLYLVIFIMCSFTMSYYWSLFGFAIANMISKIFLLVAFLILLKRIDIVSIKEEPAIQKGEKNEIEE